MPTVKFLANLLFCRTNFGTLCSTSLSLCLASWMYWHWMKFSCGLDGTPLSRLCCFLSSCLKIDLDFYHFRLILPHGFIGRYVMSILLFHKIWLKDFFLLCSVCDTCVSKTTIGFFSKLAYYLYIYQEYFLWNVSDQLSNSAAALSYSCFLCLVTLLLMLPFLFSCWNVFDCPGGGTMKKYCIYRYSFLCMVLWYSMSNWAKQPVG